MDNRPHTARQREILNLDALGKTDKDIGLELGIGTETVQSQLKSLRERFDQSSRSAILAQVPFD